VFCHPRDTKHAGKPVLDVKNAFHAALRTAKIRDFTWHDFRHHFASRLVMAGVSLRAVAELLGHKGLRMVMRYPHLSPGYLSDEIHKLDGFRLRPSTAAPAEVASPSPASAPSSEGRRGQRARKGQSARRAAMGRPRFAILLVAPQAGFEPANPPVNRLTQVVGLAGFRAENWPEVGQTFAPCERSGLRCVMPIAHIAGTATSNRS
jgi:hypothetical protein